MELRAVYIVVMLLGMARADAHANDMAQASWLEMLVLHDDVDALRRHLRSESLLVADERALLQAVADGNTAVRRPPLLVTSHCTRASSNATSAT